MNRILQYVRPHSCQCCESLHQIERQLDLATIEAERIELVIGNIAEFWIPDASRVVRPKADDDGEVGIRLMVGIEPRLATIGEDLRQYAIAELRGLAIELDAAADRLEGGAE